MNFLTVSKHPALESHQSTGGDVHPSLGCIQPEDTHGALSIVGYDHGYRAVQGHGVVQLVLEHVQVVKPIRVSPTEGANNSAQLMNPDMLCSFRFKIL